MDEAIYNAHIDNEDFYAKVSEMITEKINNREALKEESKPKKNRLLSFMTQIMSRIRRTIKGKETKELPDGITDESVLKENPKEKFFKSLRVLPDELKNITEQKPDNPNVELNKEDPIQK